MDVTWREPADAAGALDPDGATVALAVRGDADAFAVLVRRHQHALVNLIRGLGANPADAEDIAQDAFVRAYRSLGRFRGASRFKTWLFQIAINAARTHWTKTQARGELPMDPAGDDERSRASASQPSSRGFESTLLARDAIDRALATLPLELREAVVLRDLEGFEYKEIAALLAVPIGTVESRIFRGRERLRASLAQLKEPRS